MKMKKRKTKQTNNFQLLHNVEVETLAGVSVLTVPGSLSAPVVTKKCTDMPVQTQRQEQK